MSPPTVHSTLSRAIGVLASTAGLLLVVNGCSADSGASSDEAAAQGDGSGERVDVDGSDGLAWGTGKDGVVLVHGASFDAASWRPQAEQFADAGVSVFAVEDTSRDSLEAAVDQLRQEQGAKQVALLGASAGGASVIEAAGSGPRFYDQLVLLSPAGGDVQSLDGAPTFFIYSKDESLADSIEEQIDQAPGDDNKVLAIDGSAHAQGIFKTDAAQQVTDAILERVTGGS